MDKKQPYKKIPKKVADADYALQHAIVRGLPEKEIDRLRKRLKSIQKDYDNGD